jgi:hypothetical protein
MEPLLWHLSSPHNSVLFSIFPASFTYSNLASNLGLSRRLLTGSILARLLKLLIQLVSSFSLSTAFFACSSAAHHSPALRASPLFSS